MNIKNITCKTCDAEQLAPFKFSPGYYRCRQCGTDYKVKESKLVCIFFSAFAKVFRAHWKKNGIFLYKLSKREYGALLAQAGIT